MEKVTAFSKVFEKQDKMIADVQKQLSEKKLEPYEAATKLSKAATSVLRDDIYYKLKIGKVIPLTKKVRENIFKQRDLLKAGDVLGVRSACGDCLICGKRFEVGDLILADKNGESSAIHVQCCDSTNELALDSSCGLFECR